MATVPGPNPDQPLPRPGVPAAEPMREPEHDPEQERRGSPGGPDSQPDWREPEPWTPERESVEQDIPAGVP